jgi:hypothetical protein
MAVLARAVDGSIDHNRKVRKAAQTRSPNFMEESQNGKFGEQLAT